MFTLLAVPTSTALAQVSTLAAHWDFSETSGLVLADLSGNNLNIALSGSVTLGVPGAFLATGTAAKFDSAGMGVGKVADQLPLSNMHDDLSVAAWVRIDAGGTFAIRRIFGGNDSAWSCGVTATGLRFTTRGILDYDFATTYPVGSWVHLAYVFDAQHDVTFYVNGVAVGTVLGSAPANPAVGSWLLGAWSGSIEYWHGEMDDVQVYDGSLTPADVAFLFQNPGAIVSPAVGTSFCVGDGSGLLCPCGNLGAAGEGCANSLAMGARLSASGSASLSAGSLEFIGERMVPGSMAILFSSQSQLNGGTGFLFGDGMRCVGDPVQRLGIRVVDAAGEARWLGPAVAAQGNWSAGQTHQLQVWYQDLVGAPCSTGFNTSQALQLAISL